jgi:hypothetical protein
MCVALLHNFDAADEMTQETFRFATRMETTTVSTALKEVLSGILCEHAAT